MFGQTPYTHPFGLAYPSKAGSGLLSRSTPGCPISITSPLFNVSRFLVLWTYLQEAATVPHNNIYGHNIYTPVGRSWPPPALPPRLRDSPYDFQAPRPSFTFAPQPNTNSSGFALSSNSQLPLAPFQVFTGKGTSSTVGVGHQCSSLGPALSAPLALQLISAYAIIFRCTLGSSTYQAIKTISLIPSAHSGTPPSSN